MKYKATAVYAIYNVGANKATEVFETYDEATEWLELQCVEYARSTGLDDFYTNGSKIEQLNKGVQA